MSSSSETVTALRFERFDGAVPALPATGSEFVPFTPEAGFAIAGSPDSAKNLRGSFHTDDEIAALVAAARAEGVAAGRESLLADVAAALGVLGGAARELERVRDGAVAEAGLATCRLVSLVSKKLIGACVADDDGSLARHFSRVLASCDQPVALRCHPRVAALLPSVAPAAALKIELDHSLAVDAFTVSVPAGIVEGSLEAQVDELVAAMRQVMSGAGADV